jgi:uncharacterized protein
MTTPIEISLTCPACGTEFRSTSLMSTNHVGRRTDFHLITAGLPPLPFLIHTCTSCGYTDYPEGFEDHKHFPPELAQRIRNEFGPLVQDGLPDGGTRYGFAAKIAEWRGAVAGVIADIYLCAAWCCVDEGQKESETIYRRLAIEHFKGALENRDALPPEERLIIVYMVGELYRRVGDLPCAHDWFDRVISEGEESAPIVRLAQRQREDPLDEMPPQ